MDTVTYPDNRVSSYVGRHFVPIKIVMKEKPDLVAAYNVMWAPNIIVSDETGKVYYRIEGFLPPPDFIGQVALAMGRYQFERQQFAAAAHHFEEVAQRHQGTDAGAQALYWLGVAQFKNSKDPATLRPSWEKLVREYPKSEWAKRANVPKKS